jgi:hypothetical protein
MSVESVAPYFAVGDHFHAGANLQVDTFFGGSVFYSFERGVGELSCGEAVARFLQVRGTQ